MKRFILVSLFAAVVYAQTGTKAVQIACTVPSGSPFGVLGFLPPGTTPARQTCFVLDSASFVLDTTKKPPVLRLVSVPTNGTAVDGETPSGVIDGTNKTFTLANVPLAASLHLYLNGVRQMLGVDYSLSAATITFLTGVFPVDPASDILQADYRH